MEASERKIPTVEEVKADLARVDQVLAGLTLHHVYTIEDYPIGRRDRGRCEMSYQFQKRGWRTSRRTTDKFGRWCKPKCSTFDECPIIVVTGPGVEHEAAWLRFSGSTVYLQGANGAGTTLYQAPHYCRPRREPHTYTMVTTKLAFGADGISPGVRTEQHHTLAADPPELCEAWEAWNDWFQSKVRELAEQIHAGAPVFA